MAYFEALKIVVGLLLLALAVLMLLLVVYFAICFVVGAVRRAAVRELAWREWKAEHKEGRK